nr:unnamed protein product [Spirometra erinaceieuropaei]
MYGHLTQPRISSRSSDKLKPLINVSNVNLPVCYRYSGFPVRPLVLVCLAASRLTMSESSESPIGGFALQGSSSSFSQRQADIFGNLQALEDAHRKVEEETASERLYVQQFWRETKPAVESLEAEKEAVGNVTGYISALYALVPFFSNWIY